MAAATVEQFQAVSAALTNAQEHIQNLSTEMDKLKISSEMDLSQATSEYNEKVERLRHESAQAVQELMARVSTMEGRRGQGEHGQSLINRKNFVATKFAGKLDEDIKPWAKSIRNYCNACRPGFRMALETTERSNEPITDDDIRASSWKPMEDANVELFEYLLTVTSGEALVLVEKYQDKGFEAWRQLQKRYNPTGGRGERGERGGRGGGGGGEERRAEESRGEERTDEKGRRV